MKLTPWIAMLCLLPPACAGETPWEQHFHRGDALERAGNYAEAAPQFETALTEAERLGPADWRLPLTLHNLGAVNRELGHYPEAERYYRRAISLWESHQPERARELAGSLHNLAVLHMMLGRLSQAEPLYRRAYELRRGALGPSDPLTASSMHGLAELLQQRRKYAEADALYLQAATVIEAAHGANSLEVADISHNRALLYRDMHRDAEARPLLERAAAIYDSAAPQHPKLAVVLRNLAELRASRGDTAEAAHLFARALRICDESLPADHPQTGVILQAYARFLQQTHRNKEARAMTERARAILAKDNREGGAAYTVDASGFVRQ
jgi:tetratricopeptide (TPR) repeat protein